MIQSLGCGIALAEEGRSMHGPGSLAAPRPPLGTSLAANYLSILGQPASTGASSPFLAALDWYRTVLSPLDGKRCEMAPTCSLYAQQAYRTHGPLWGFILTADRLLHEADEQGRVRSYVLKGERFYVDPLGANIYWW
jgi:hypothetical protein